MNMTAQQYLTWKLNTVSVRPRYAGCVDQANLSPQVADDDAAATSVLAISQLRSALKLKLAQLTVRHKTWYPATSCHCSAINALRGNTPSCNALYIAG